MSRFQRRNSDNGNGKRRRFGKYATGEANPNFSHGGHALVRLLRERNLDLRRADHRFLHDWKENLIEDLGGPKEISVLQSTMIDQAVSLVIILNKMSEYVEEKGIMAVDGELAACLRHSYLQYCNSLRHCLTTAYDASRLKPKKPLNLRDYLESNYSQSKEGEDGTAKEGNRDGETRLRRSDRTEEGGEDRA